MSINILIEVATEEIIKNNSELPPAGELWTDSNGKIICHICGKSYGKLTAHLVGAHNMSADQYRETYGLNRTQKLTSLEYQKQQRDRPRTDLKNHRKKGQFKSGKTSVRKGTKARLQSILERPQTYNKKRA